MAADPVDADAQGVTRVTPAAGDAHSFGGAAHWYVISLVAAQVLMLALFLVVAAHPWFLEHDNYPLLRYSLGYSMQARNVDCDIVLYGDSAPLTGLDPAYIQRRTGLKTCNLSELRSVHWLVSSYFPLDQYLAHNSRPKFILSEWAPVEFHPEPKAMVSYQVEGFEYALLYARGPALWTGWLRHPIWPVWFSSWVGRSMIDDFLDHLDPDHNAKWNAYHLPRAATAGFWRVAEPTENHCMTAQEMQGMMNGHRLTREETKAAIAQFKRRYSVGGTEVIVDVAAIADCVPDHDQLVAATQGLGDDQLQFLPLRYFNSQDIHYTPEGSRFVSAEAAEQILRMMGDESAKNKQ